MCPLSVADKSGDNSSPSYFEPALYFDVASEATTGFIAPLSPTACSDSDATDSTHAKDLSPVAIGAPPGLSGDDAAPLPGSAQHGTGKCVPCFWRWKPQGCAYGAGCDYCHSCPEGEVKARRKARLASLRGAEGASISLSSAYWGQPEEPVSAPAQAQELLPRAVPIPPAPPAPADRLSVGSALHGTGECRPCSWFYKPGGCQNGKDCCHCHLCPEGEIKARRRHKFEGVRVDARKKESGGPPAPSAPGAAGLPKLLGSPAAPPSLGSAHHGTSLCRPCAFFWKPEGCVKGSLCQHCHMCPDGELMARRRMKQALVRKALAAQADQMQHGAGLDSQRQRLALAGAIARNPAPLQVARQRALAEPMSIPLPQDFSIVV